MNLSRDILVSSLCFFKCNLYRYAERFRAQQKALRSGKEGAYPAQFRGQPNAAALKAKAA